VLKRKGKNMKKLFTAIAIGSIALASSPVFADDGKAVQVSVGYANNWDGTQNVHPFLPDPWIGGVDIFAADPVTSGGAPQCGSNCYDSGAILLYNPSKYPLTIDAVTVDVVGGYTFNIWTTKLPNTIPPHGTMILAQTGGSDNFESSNVNQNCVPNGFIPVIHVTMGTKTKNFKDKNQVLNAGGFDKSA
jgi:hypothetical protein